MAKGGKDPLREALSRHGAILGFKRYGSAGAEVCRGSEGEVAEIGPPDERIDCGRRVNLREDTARNEVEGIQCLPLFPRGTFGRGGREPGDETRNGRLPNRTNTE